MHSFQKTLLLCILLLGVLGETSFGKDSREKRVLLIGIDGLRPDALRAAETPYLDSLIAEGCLSETTRILGERYRKNDTISGPGWSSFLTGVWADKHGVHDNSFKGKNYREYPHFFARLKEVYPNAQTGSFVDWEPIDKHIVSHADVRRVFPSSELDTWQRNDEEVARAASHFLSTEDPTATMIYFGTVDETGHRHGFHPSVDLYRQAITAVDRHVGRVIAAIRGRETYQAENWLVLVSTDHGGKGTGHSGGADDPEINNTFLIVSGPSASRGSIDTPSYVVDVPATALVHLDVPLDPKWQLDGKAVGLKR